MAPGELPVPQELGERHQESMEDPEPLEPAELPEDVEAKDNQENQEPGELLELLDQILLPPLLRESPESVDQRVFEGLQTR